MPIADNAEHIWSQARLELHRARLLEPEDEARLATHAAGCDACREALAAVQAHKLPAGHGEHVPASVLARWPAIADRLPALESELVRQHMHDCASCREDLAIARAHAAPAPVRLKPVPVRWERIWAIGATAAAAGFAVLLWVAPQKPMPAVPASGAMAPLALATLSVETAPVAVMLHDVTRGSTGSAPTLVTPGPREPVVLTCEPLDVPDDTPVELEVSSAAGLVQAHVTRLQRELYPARQLVIGDAASPLADGDHVLRVIAWPGSARADSLSLAFTVRRR